MDIDSLVRRYELKHPSFKTLDRPRLPRLDSGKVRFETEEGGLWRGISENKEKISILIAGDLLCQQGLVEGYLTEPGEWDFSPCFQYIRPLLEASDLAIGNLETPISHTAPLRWEILTHEGPFYCNAPRAYLQAVRDAGFDMLTTANNHTADAGVRGILETIQAVREAGFIQTGTNSGADEPKYVIVDVCGFRIGFTAFSTTHNFMDQNINEMGKSVLMNAYSPVAAKRVYQEMKERGAEYVVCFPHWGIEYSTELGPRQLNMVRHMANIGYDFIAGSHPHVVQRYDQNAPTPTLYSLGNLVSHISSSSRKAGTRYPVICQLGLTRTSAGIRSDVRFIPCLILEKNKAIPFAVIPYAKSLGLDGASFPVLDEAKEKACELLRVDESFLNLSCSAKGSLPQGSLEDLVIAIEEEEVRAKNAQEGRLPEITEKVYQAVLEDWDGRDGCRLVCCYEAVYEVDQVNGEAKVLALVAPGEASRVRPDIDGVPVTALQGDYAKADTLRILYLGKNVEVVGKRACAGFPGLEGVRIFDGLRVIGEEAFADNPKMTGLILPHSLERIEARAFAGCGSLLSIKIPASVEYMAPDAFAGCDQLTIYCGKGSYAARYAEEQDIPFSTLIASLAPRDKGEDASSCSSNLGLPSPISPSVRRGAMNGFNDSHPVTIFASCEALGSPLPPWAICKNPPSYYLGEDRFPDTLDGIRGILGGLLSDVPEKELLRRFNRFVAKYKSQQNLRYTSTDFAVYFSDWMLFARRQGHSATNYFDYELFNKEPEIRKTFANTEFRERVFRACISPEAIKEFGHKPTFNKRYRKWVKRDWLDVNECSWEEFKAFAERHGRFFAKPLAGHGGQGARVMDAGEDSIEDLYLICCGEGMIVEEIIQQHAALAAFNESTLNTIRVITLLCQDGTVRLLMGIVRFGREGNCVDNFHGGGVAAVLDVDTGVVVSDAINRSHIRTPMHPDSGVPILGFECPEWEKIKRAVIEAAAMTPQARHIGWDVSVTKDGEIEFVEGNCKSGYDALQAPDQVGRIGVYAPYIREIEKAQGVEAQRDFDDLVVLKGKRWGRLLRRILGDGGDRKI